MSNFLLRTFYRTSTEIDLSWEKTNHTLFYKIFHKTSFDSSWSLLRVVDGKKNSFSYSNPGNLNHFFKIESSLGTESIISNPQRDVSAGPALSTATGSTPNPNTVLISYWKLDEASGTRFDSKGNNHFTQSGSPHTSSGILNNGLLFSEIGYLEVDTTTLRPNLTYGFTICGWVNTNLINAVDSNPFNLTNFDGGAYSFDLDFQSSAINFSAFDNDITSDTFNLIPCSSYSPNTWVFFRCWFNPTDHLIHAKLNEGTTINGTVPLTNFASLSTASFLIDRFSGGAGPIFKVDEVSFYQGILTDLEGSTLYGAGSPPSFPNVPYGT